MFQTLDECFEWLYEPREFPVKYDLSRMHLALRAVGDPIDYKTIHVGGTNGKGSTVTYLKHALIQAGYKVGTFISPYVVVFNERITLNHDYIKDDEFIYYMNHIYTVLQLERLTLSYFEILTVLAYLYFKDQEVDYAIMEVGLGGRLDSTNVMPNKEIALITNIGHDHMAELGDDINGIAKEKLGIVDDALVTTVQPEFHELFSKYTTQRGATISFVEEPTNVVTSLSNTTFDFRDYHVTLSMLGEHQAKNATLAIAGLEYMREHKGLVITNEQITEGLKRAFWPGRLEKISETVYIDGGHNEEGVETLVRFLETVDEPKRIVFTCLADKPYEKMIQLVDAACDELVLTEFKYERAIAGETLFDFSKHPNKTLIKNYKDTYTVLDDKMTIYCGSLYFISKIRQDLLK